MSYGHIDTMDLSYIGQLAVKIGQYVWKLNVIGMSKVSRTGVGDGVEAQQKRTKVGVYELCFSSIRRYHFLAGWGLMTT